jgi:hypothetical protein
MQVEVRTAASTPSTEASANTVHPCSQSRGSGAKRKRQEVDESDSLSNEDEEEEDLGARRRGSLRSSPQPSPAKETANETPFSPPSSQSRGKALGDLKVKKRAIVVADLMAQSKSWIFFRKADDSSPGVCYESLTAIAVDNEFENSAGHKFSIFQAQPMTQSGKDTQDAVAIAIKCSVCRNAKPIMFKKKGQIEWRGHSEIAHSMREHTKYASHAKQVCELAELPSNPRLRSKVMVDEEYVQITKYSVKQWQEMRDEVAQQSHLSGAPHAYIYY